MKDAIQTALAANSNVSNDPPTRRQDCRDDIHISFFFDGTGNNEEKDTPDKKWSNISRLHRAARYEPENGIYRYYIAGVGTPHNKPEAVWEKPWALVRDYKYIGGSFGLGGDSRLDEGETKLSEALEKTLLMNANQLGGNIARDAKAKEGEGFENLNKTLAKHRLIKMINISVFGFSRGAALARAFVNKVHAECKTEQGKLTLYGYPVRFVFLGVFDTVASFGLPASNNTLPWQERDLKLPACLENCTHFVAAHELRYSFPVDLVRKNGQYEGNITEVVYPGAHSDVGGGYKPIEQEKKNDYARIPLTHMHQAAMQRGVRLQGLNWLEQNLPPIYQRFEIPATASQLYQAYTKQVGASGTVEAQMKKHMQLFYRYHGTMSRLGKTSSLLGLEDAKKVEAQKKQALQEAQQAHQKTLTSLYPSRAQKAAQEKAYQAALTAKAEHEAAVSTREEAEKVVAGNNAIREEAEYIRACLKAGKKPRLQGTYDELRFWFPDPPQWAVDEFFSEQNVSQEIIDFFNQYIHDSKAGFGLNFLQEPFSYFAQRAIYEQLKPTHKRVTERTKVA